MNRILKNILTTARDLALESATKTIPGASVVISGVTKLVDHDHTNNGGAITEIGNGVVTAIESLKGEDVVDEVLVAQGVMEVKGGLDKIKRGLR